MPCQLDKRGVPLGRFANADNLLSQHARFLLGNEQSEAIVAEMENFISVNWYSIARAEGVSEVDCNKIASAFVYAGFRIMGSLF